MSIQWSTTSSGSWDEKYPQLDPANLGLPLPIPTEPIVYPENPGDLYIMKPVSHSWADVSEMILHCVHSSSQDIKYHPVCDQLYQLINSIRDPNTVLEHYAKIYNHLFFGGMVRSSVVEDSADDEIKIIYDLELVSDDIRAGEVRLNLDNNLGLTKGIFDGRINRVTIYILDVLTLHLERDYHEVVSEMLGTLAHEMIHAMQLMYTKYPGDELGVIYATHGTNFQKAAQAIEQATRNPSGGEGWIYPKIEVGRYWGVFYDIRFEKYKEPTDTEIRNMGLDVEKLRGILRMRLNA
ncbi:uncharacterized protein Bfra_010803 [Botrytis fragariae]|uniref:SprT-like domain-containing protein n=1 Tax=Botrytis fragariae TaxID=1964551 RepID=A0A8H6AL52_9HELO|nr:uncharacterized protein Bfra_010803 [Botrytis fragariae]KAF5869606.1 hypothetical protein Bfra_010803 [Botrytis fragariae]